MTKEPFRWQPDIISRMTTEAIVNKLKQLVPGFDLDSFIAKTGDYLSCEDLTEAEYYPHASFSDEDEDFIWMACEELWQRLVPDKPALELVAQQFDNLCEEIIRAAQKRRLKEVFRHSREVLDLIYRHTIEAAPEGRRLRRQFYEKLRDTTAYDLENFLSDLMQNMIGHEEYEKVVDIAGTLGKGLDDDVFLEHKAEGLFGLGRGDEGERLFHQIISRNPDDPWFLLHAGDCHFIYGKKDCAKAKNYYLQALDIARENIKKPDGKDELRAVYQRLIDLADETGNRAESDRYMHLLESLEARKVGRNDPCPCGSGKKYKRCCGK